MRDGKVTTGWGITATVSTDEKVILWSDKTLWTRP